ncbi:MAG: polysaccharide deacetylase family protein [Rhodocyclaceae bacterium]|nr:polysaccharide deacetylase family protein [Rhodocyclaceae bacterium]
MIWRNVYRLLSPRGGRARLSILINHRVLPAADPLIPGEPDARLFEARVRMLRDTCNLLSLTEALDRLAEGSLPERAAVVTFDDGYADNHDIAMPILHKLGVPATFFIATGFLGGGIMFNDQVVEAVRGAQEAVLDLAWLGLGKVPVAGLDAKRAAIERILPIVKYLPFDARREAGQRLAREAGVKYPVDLMMTHEQVRAMHRGGMEMGGHTRNHPILAGLDTEAARAEIENGKADVEDVLGRRIDLFAYPNGKPGVDYTVVHAALARAAGYRCALSTATGSVGAGADLYQLARFMPWGPGPWRYQAQIAGNLLREPELSAANVAA